MLDEYGGIPDTFNNRDAELCKNHLKQHPPMWTARSNAWIVVVNYGCMSCHCHVQNPETGERI